MHTHCKVTLQGLGFFFVFWFFLFFFFLLSSPKQQKKTYFNLKKKKIQHSIKKMQKYKKDILNACIGTKLFIPIRRATSTAVSVI